MSLSEVNISRLSLFFFVLVYCLFFLLVFCLLSWRYYPNMDVLTRFCVSADLSKDEFLCRLRAIPEDIICLSTVRQSLFNTAVGSGLVDTGVVLVGRRKVGGGAKSVGGKHAEDIWVLVGAIRNHRSVPRVLLRNGKRSKTALVQSQERVKSALPDAQATQSTYRDMKEAHEDCVDACMDSCTAAGCGCDTSIHNVSSRAPLLEDISDLTFKSSVLRNINALKNSISDIQHQIHSLRITESGTMAMALSTPKPI